MNKACHTVGVILPDLRWRVLICRLYTRLLQSREVEIMLMKEVGSGTEQEKKTAQRRGCRLSPFALHVRRSILKIDRLKNSCGLRQRFVPI